MPVVDKQVIVSAESHAMVDEHVVHQDMHSSNFVDRKSVLTLVGNDYKLPHIKPGTVFEFGHIKQKR